MIRPLAEVLREAEANHIRTAVAACGRLKEAARLLGIAPDTLREKRRALNLPLCARGPRRKEVLAA